LMVVRAFASGPIAATDMGVQFKSLRWKAPGP
jgi:hypothetical protein